MSSSWSYTSNASNGSGNSRNHAQRTLATMCADDAPGLSGNALPRLAIVESHCRMREMSTVRAGNVNKPAIVACVSSQAHDCSTTYGTPDSGFSATHKSTKSTPKTSLLGNTSIWAALDDEAPVTAAELLSDDAVPSTTATRWAAVRATLSGRKVRRCTMYFMSVVLVIHASGTGHAAASTSQATPATLSACRSVDNSCGSATLASTVNNASCPYAPFSIVAFVDAIR
mmetsp:Transcript_6346/g.10991  ORF Transcript_6346/g.10991 Transcript_6346/m.10991 type:complete len:228 (+) Transcript_6346:789-1472(+)